MTSGANAGSETPNLLLVILDCVRYKNVDPNGSGPRARAPALDALAKRGTWFSRAVSPGNWTIPSHMSIFSGVYPAAHGVRSFTQGPAPFESLASWLGRRGYRTGLFTETVHLVGGYGLESGFGERYAPSFGMTDDERTVSNRIAARARFLYSPGVRRAIENLPPLVFPLNAVNHPQEVAFKRRVVGDYLLPDFDAWLGRSDGRPFHATVNFADAHEPYDLVTDGRAPSRFERGYARTPRYYLLAVPQLQSYVPWPDLERGYVRSIESADRKLGELLRLVERHGQLDRTLVVVTSDHGQSFGERGNVYHGCGASESILRVPLIAAPPAGRSLPGRIDAWVSGAQVPGWMKAASAGLDPFDDLGRAPLPFGAGFGDGTVFSEGSPASDPNRSLAGVRVDRRWNHRLVAAYSAETKHLLDLETGETFGWSTDGDPDRDPPVAYTGVEGERVRASVFGPYERLDELRRGDASLPPRKKASLHPGLVSWGYD